MPRRPFARGWSNQFSREPLNVYQEKERERTVGLVEAAQKDAGLPPIPSFGGFVKGVIQKKQAELRSAMPPALPSAAGRFGFGAETGMGAKPGGGFLGKVKSVTVDPAMKALSTLDELSAATPASLFTRGTVENGQYTTERNIIGNPIANIQSHVSAQRQAGLIGNGNPVLEGIKAQMRAGRAFQQDPDIAPGVRVGATIGFNPMTWAGPGVVRGIAGKILPAGAARAAAFLLENPARASVGAGAGAAGAAQFGEDIPGLNRVPEQYRPLVGGVAGGMAPSVPGILRSIGKRLPDLAMEGAPVAAAMPSGESGRVRVFHGTAGDLQGDLRPGAFVTTNESDAWTFARAEARLNGGEPKVYSFEAAPGAVRPADEQGLAAARGAMQVEDPGRLYPTVQTKDLFGNVTDTGKTEGQLNGWTEADIPKPPEQPDLFGSAPQKPVQSSFMPPAPPKGIKDKLGNVARQAGLFGDDPMLPVAERRARMAGQEGNNFARMSGDQILEAIGAPEEVIRQYKRIDAEARLPNGKPDTHHPEWSMREAIRKRATEEYVRRNPGATPSNRLAPGARAEKYAAIDQQLADLRAKGYSEDAIRAVMPDTGGEFEGSFAGYKQGSPQRAERAMQLEKIASDDTLDPALRDKARQKLMTEAGGELTGRRAGETGIVSEEPSAGAAMFKNVFGGTPVQIAARGAAGFAGAKLEGEDTSEAFKKGLLNMVPGAAGRAALRNERGYANVLRAVAKGSDDNLKVKAEAVTLPHSQIKEIPELFQGRNADPGLSYSESRVKQIMAEFDPNRMEQGLLVKHTGDPFRTAAGETINTGDQVVLGGHHRLEVMKRQAAAGNYPEQASWRVLPADLTNPADVAEARTIAILTNTGTAPLTLGERLTAYHVLEQGGLPEQSIRDQMRLSDAEFADLKAMSKLPGDITDRLEQMSKTSHEGAAEIARIAAEGGLDEANTRAALGRYVFNQDKALTRGQIRKALEPAVSAYKERQAAGMQGGLFGDTFDTLLQDADALANKVAELNAQRTSLARMQSALSKHFGDDPNAAALIKESQRRIDALQAEVDDLQNNFGRSAPPPEPDVLDTSGRIEAPAQTGPDLFGETKSTPPPQSERPVSTTPELTPMAKAGLEAQRRHEQWIADFKAKVARENAARTTGRMAEMAQPAPAEAAVTPPAIPSKVRAIRKAERAAEMADQPRPEAPMSETIRGTTEPSTEDIRWQPWEKTPEEAAAARLAEQNMTAEQRAAQAAADKERTMAWLRGDVEHETPPTTGAHQPPAPGAGLEPQGVEGVDIGTARGAHQPAMEGAGLEPQGVAARADVPEPGTPRQARTGMADTEGNVPQGQRVADLTDEQIQRINDNWAELSKPPEPAKQTNPLDTGLHYVNEASRAAFASATSGDLGASFIQNAILFWTHPVDAMRHFGDSMHAWVSAPYREEYRTMIRSRIEAAMPEGQKAAAYDKVYKMGFAISPEAKVATSDLASHWMESQKLGAMGSWFRGARRQFEVQTEGMRTTAFTDQIKLMRAAKKAAGADDFITDAELQAAVNVANHLTGATKMGLRPEAGVLFGAPRFLASTFWLVRDALVQGGISGSYARRQLAQSFGTVLGITAAYNMASSGGKDLFGPGLGTPADWKSPEDVWKTITSSNFGRIRVADADISLFGPLDPLARAFFKEVANGGRIVAGDDKASIPGSAAVSFFEGKLSPVARMATDVIRGENKYTGAQYNNVADYATDKWDSIFPIAAQNLRQAIEGDGSYLGTVTEFLGIKSSPTTANERALTVLNSIPDNYWVVDAKTNTMRPPASVWEVPENKREELRKQYPEIEKYLSQKEADPHAPPTVLLRQEYEQLQIYRDTMLTSGKNTTEQWRSNFVADQQARSIRRQVLDPNVGDREPTTQGQADLNAYYAIWDDPKVQTKVGVDSGAAEDLLTDLRTKVGQARWDEMQATLGWDKSPVVRDYLANMQEYSRVLRTIPKYNGVEPADTRRIDTILRKVREQQAVRPGVPGRYILMDMQDQGQMSADDMVAARRALAGQYAPEYSEWKATPEAQEILAWFKPVRMTEGEIQIDASQAGGSGGGSKLSSRRGGGRRRGRARAA